MNTCILNFSGRYFRFFVLLVYAVAVARIFRHVFMQPTKVIS